MNGTTKAGIGTITIITAVIGGVALAGAAASASVLGARELRTGSSVASADVAGVTSLDVEAEAAEVRVEFYDGDEARLEGDDGDLEGWRLERDEDELVVRNPDRGWSWFLPDWLQDEERVTLLLPRSMEGVDADLTVRAGSLDASGDFGELDVTTSAGAATLEGSADSLDAEVNAGRADITLDGVRVAEFSVSAGKIVADLTAVPREVSAQVSAGELALTVPNEAYDVRQDASAGDVDNGLQVDSDSPNVIDVQVSAGSVTLRADD